MRCFNKAGGSVRACASLSVSTDTGSPSNAMLRSTASGIG